MIIQTILGLHIMTIALITFCFGTFVMGLRWLRCAYLKIPFRRFPKLLFTFGLCSSVISVMFFAGIQEIILQYIFSTSGIIYFISVIWVQQKEKP